MIDEKYALSILLELLAIEGTSGREGRIAQRVRKELLSSGCRPSWIKADKAHKHIGEGYTVGNLIVKLPGTVRGPRLLFSTHLDTVPLCRGAVPMRKGSRIIAKGNTGLGADDRTGVGCLLVLARTLLRGNLDFPPITLLFTVGEEQGLKGARWVDPSALGRPQFGFNFDGGSPAALEIAAPAAERWEAEIYGFSAHAGMAPEKGVSAALIFAAAAAELSRKGWLGRIKKDKHCGTANIGIVRGGEATNQVMDYLYIKGESRSDDQKFVSEITGAIRAAFTTAAANAVNKTGKKGRCSFRTNTDYEAFALSQRDPIVQYVQAVLKRTKYKPAFVKSGGGFDANHLNKKGIPTINLGAGFHRPHTVEEYVNIPEYLDACRIALQFAASFKLLKS